MQQSDRHAGRAGDQGEDAHQGGLCGVELILVAVTCGAPAMLLVSLPDSCCSRGVDNDAEA